ncbi:MAG TPA: hypothetical protein VIG99_23750 [Myxococcaceae bacterium]
MNAPRTRFFALAALLAAGCAPMVEVQTEPISQTIPITSVGLQSYVELAIDLPPQSQGDVHVENVTADLQVHNASRATNMLLELRVSLSGTATPEVPFPFTQANRPSYFAESVALLGPKVYDGGTTTQEHIEGAGLIPAIGKPRLWLIVSNTVTSIGLGDSLSSLQLNLNQVVLHAVVTKSLAGAGGGLETTGL